MRCLIQWEDVDVGGIGRGQKPAALLTDCSGFIDLTFLVNQFWAVIEYGWCRVTFRSININKYQTNSIPPIETINPHVRFLPSRTPRLSQSHLHAHLGLCSSISINSGGEKANKATRSPATARRNFFTLGLAIYARDSRSPLLSLFSLFFLP